VHVAVLVPVSVPVLLALALGRLALGRLAQVSAQRGAPERTMRL